MNRGVQYLRDNYHREWSAWIGHLSAELTLFRNTWSVGVRGVTAYTEIRARKNWWTFKVSVEKSPIEEDE